MASTLRVLCCLLWVAAVRGWLNDYDQPVNFQCPDGQFLSHINSMHDNGREDRVWDYSCSPIPAKAEGATTTDCQWTNYVNEFDQPLTFQCPGDQVIAGMASVHDNGKEDRQFKFRCCTVPGTITHGCYFTNWENEWDGILDYTVPINKVLKGMESYHDNGKEDRRFKFDVCDILSV